MIWVVFWTMMIFLSIAWYASLLFYVGFKGAKEIKTMTRRLQDGSSDSEADSGKKEMP